MLQDTTGEIRIGSRPISAGGLSKQFGFVSKMGFPELEAPFLGGPMIRIRVFWGLYAVPIQGNYQRSPSFTPSGRFQWPSIRRTRAPQFNYNLTIHYLYVSDYKPLKRIIGGHNWLLLVKAVHTRKACVQLP